MIQRILGIDYGSTRIGLAISDETGRIAFPHGTVANLREVCAVIQRQEIQRIVIGVPVPFGGGASAQSRAASAFAVKLKRTVQLPVVLENEVLTSKLARRGTQPRSVDASAAALILQSYLDRVNAYG